MIVDLNSGLVDGLAFKASPNCDARPALAPIDMIIVHSISLPPGKFGGDNIEKLFTNCLDHQSHPYFDEIRDLKVSSHFLIHRDGSLVQFVPVSKRAWHAGVSCFHGRECCNDYSIGIELEGADDIPYEADQYKVLAELAASLMSVFPGITAERIVGHSDVAPGRKTDPGEAFDWEFFNKLLAEKLDA